MKFFRLFLFLAFSSFVWAISFPTLDSQVVDDAGLFSSEQKSQLITVLNQQEQNSSNQIVVVTVKTLEGNDIAEYGYQLGRKWGIGDKKRNNGVLLIIAPNERKVRIEVGYGLEGALTDANSKLIIRNIITPYFKKGDYYTGALHGVKSIIDITNPEYSNDEKSTNKKGDIPLVVILFPLLFLFITFLSSFAHQTPQKRPIGVAFLGATVAGLLSWGMLMIVAASVVIAVVVFFLILFGGFGNATANRTTYSGNNDIDFGSFSGGNYSSGGTFGGFSGGGGSFGGGGASGDW